MNVDNLEYQEPEYDGPPIAFQIPAPPLHLNPYVSAAMVQPFLNNVALQYANSRAPSCFQYATQRKFTQEGTPAAQALNPALLYQMYLKV